MGAYRVIWAFCWTLFESLLGLLLEGLLDSFMAFVPFDPRMLLSLTLAGIIMGGTTYGDDGDLDPELRSPPEFRDVQLSYR